MPKKRIVIIISIAFAVFILAAAALYVFKNINETPPIVVEQSLEASPRRDSSPSVPTRLLSATFIGVDDIHWGRGSAEIVSTQGGRS